MKVKLRGAGTFWGVVESENPNEVVIQIVGGVRITLSRSEIESISPIGPQEYRNANRTTYAKLLAAAKRRDKESWLAWWKALKFARKFDLNPELWDTYSQMTARWNDLRRRTAEYNAYQLYRKALYYYTRGMENSAIKTAKRVIDEYEKTSYAPQAAELLSLMGIKPPAVAAVHPRPSPGIHTSPKKTPAKRTPALSPQPRKTTPPPPENRVQKLPKATTEEIKNANTLYSRGKKAITDAFDALEDDDFKKAVELFNRAAALLKKARELYENALLRNPRRGDIESFIEQVNKLIYLAKKSKPIGVWR